MKKPLVVTINGSARHGKDTLASFLMQHLISSNPQLKVQLLHFADKLKEECLALGWNGEKDEAGRTLLQEYGNAKRQEDINYWVTRVEDQINEDTNIVLIPDFRYPNETTYFRENGYPTIAVKIERYNEDGTLYDNGLTPEQKNHISEVALRDFNFDIRIACLSGIENVERQAKALAQLLIP